MSSVKSVSKKYLVPYDKAQTKKGQAAEYQYSSEGLWIASATEQDGDSTGTGTTYGASGDQTANPYGKEGSQYALYSNLFSKLTTYYVNGFSPRYDLADMAYTRAGNTVNDNYRGRGYLAGWTRSTSLMYGYSAFCYDSDSSGSVRVYQSQKCSVNVCFCL